MRGNGGQVAMCAGIVVTQPAWRWHLPAIANKQSAPARHCHVCRHCGCPASEALAGGCHT